ncbi:MAG: DUF6105 family protein, partial [Pseudomonadota bacterium]
LSGGKMRYIFWFWFVPMALLWSWLGLSYYDISFGMAFLSRDAFDFVFDVYSSILGIERDVIIGLLIRACIVDTGLIFLIYGFRRRKDIRAWWANRQARRAGTANEAVQDMPSVIPPAPAPSVASSPAE